MAKSLTKDAPSMALSPFELPEEFSGTGLDVVATYAQVPYVVFAQPKATDQWTALATRLPGMQDGDQVLVWPEPRLPERLSPMRFTMVCCKQYWVQKLPGGARGPVSVEQKPWKSDWAEEVHAACVVYVQRDGGLEAVPASCTFKTVKTRAALSVKLQVEAAAREDWAGLSEVHRMAYAALAKPFLRVVGTVSVQRSTGPTGNPMAKATASVVPASPAEWRALKELSEDPGDAATKRPSGRERLAALARSYHGRLATLGIKQ